PIFELQGVGFPRQAAAVVFFVPLIAANRRLSVVPDLAVVHHRAAGGNRSGGERQRKSPGRKHNHSPSLIPLPGQHFAPVFNPTTENGWCRKATRPRSKCSAIYSLQSASPFLLLLLVFLFPAWI